MLATANTNRPSGPFIKGYKMSQVNTQSTPKNSTLVNGATFTVDTNLVNNDFKHVYAELTKFINTKAGGKADNIAIVPLTTFEDLGFGKGGKQPCTKLGGYMDGAVNGKSLYGVRQSMLYHALNGKLSYGQWLIACLNTKTPKPHNIGIPSGAQSATSPNVMAMLLCGGPSVGKGSWGTPKVQLVVKGKTVPKTKK